MILLFQALLMGFLLICGALGLMHMISKYGTNDAVNGVQRWILTIILLAPIVISLKLGYGIIALGCVLVFGTLIAIMWAPRWGELLALPFTSAMTGGDIQVEARPYYSRANGLRKRGQYAEALEEIMLQLVRFPDDFEGLMLRAEIQLENFKDTRSALETLNEIEQTPGRAIGECLVARLKQVDILMKQPDGRSAARLILVNLVEEYPGSEAAQIARQRLAHLPDPTAAESEVTKQRRLLVVTQSPKVGLGTDGGRDLNKPPDHQAEAAGLLAHLEAHPMDWDSRERLAVLYLQELHEPKLAQDQLEYLLHLPDVPERKIVLWLNKLTDLHVDLDNMEAAKQTLIRLISLFPETVQATRAQFRLDNLGIEARKHRATRTVAMAPAPTANNAEESIAQHSPTKPKREIRLVRSKHIALPASIKPVKGTDPS
jgi:tetratricopeptide (TPR) repeat protein